MEGTGNDSIKLVRVAQSGVSHSHKVIAIGVGRGVQGVLQHSFLVM